MSQPTRAETTRAATVRLPLLGEERGKYDLPPGVVPPPGYRYEWKRVELTGQPDKGNITDLMEGHWERVPADRHPELGLKGWEDYASTKYIERKGLVLCERREELCLAAEDRVRLETQQITADKEAEMGKSQDARNFPRTAPNLSQTVETPDGVRVPASRRSASRQSARTAPTEQGSVFEE